MSRVLLSCAVAGLLSGSTVLAHHTVPGRTHPTVRITQPVIADGKPLAAGTYEIWITDERPSTAAGTSDAQRVVEFAQNGQVVAREIAEVFPRAGAVAVGTSGGGSSARARVERLREGDFVRISINEADGRYLIHLPTGSTPSPAASPAPTAAQPQ